MSLVDKLSSIGASVVASLGLLSGSDSNAQTTNIPAIKLWQPVTLEWDPSPDSNVVAYDIYLGYGSRTYSISSVFGNVTTANSLGEIDKTMYYAATAIADNGLESEFSNEISYKVPNVENIRASLVNTNGNYFYQLKYFPISSTNRLRFLQTTNELGGNISSDIWSPATNIVELQNGSEVSQYIPATQPFPKYINFINARFNVVPTDDGSPSDLISIAASSPTLEWRASRIFGTSAYIIYAHEQGSAFTNTFGAATNTIGDRVRKTIPATSLKTNALYTFFVKAKIGPNPTDLSKPTNPVTAVNAGNTYINNTDKTPPQLTLENTESMSYFRSDLTGYPKGSEKNPFYCLEGMMFQGKVADSNYIKSLFVSGDVRSSTYTNFPIAGGNFLLGFNPAREGLNRVKILASDMPGNFLTNEVSVYKMGESRDYDGDKRSDLYEFMHFRNPFSAIDAEGSSMRIGADGKKIFDFTAQNFSLPNMPYYVRKSTNLVDWYFPLDYDNISYTTNKVTGTREGHYIERNETQRGFFESMDGVTLNGIDY